MMLFTYNDMVITEVVFLLIGFALGLTFRGYFTRKKQFPNSDKQKLGSEKHE